MISLKANPRQYADLYTWSHPLGDNIIAHQDGAVSVLIEWDGIDSELLTPDQRSRSWESVYTALSAVPVGWVAEWHLWREKEETLADAYLLHGEKMTRPSDLARTVRHEQAAHLRRHSRNNTVGLVLTKPPVKRVFLGAKRALTSQSNDAAELLETANAITSNLAGARIATVADYAARIVQSYDRERYKRGNAIGIDPRFLLNEQLVRFAPAQVKNTLTQGDITTQVLLFYLYPDAVPAWFVGMSTLPIDMHVVSIIRPKDTREALKASEKKSDFAEGSLGRKGRSLQARVVQDLADFQNYVATNSLSIFDNSYIVHLHGKAEEVSQYARSITDWCESAGGQIRDADYMQLPYYRSAMPGQGYRVPMLRPDHTWQVGNMLPVQVYRTGEADPESLRLGAAGQLVGFSVGSQSVPHSFTVAMTGAGKGVDKVATIAETFPFSIDWYIAEIGGSYKWIVEGFGGIYSRIDPSDTVVNPLPPFSIADLTQTYPLNAVISGGTVNSLAFLLTDGNTSLDIHQQRVAEDALQMLYSVPDTTREAPTLPDFLAELDQADYPDAPEQNAAKHMSSKLHSFLETTGGRVFTRQDNLVLSEGITGVDLKDVDRASPKMLKFYLVFLALRFSHLAFARRNPARVLLDEMHKFIAIAPEVMGKLISELARMGRKDAAAIDLVTQGIAEIDCIEKEVLNSMPGRSLLYRPDEHNTIAERISMPEGALATWKAYPDPSAFPWRPAMRSVGSDYFNLHLTFPRMLLDLAATGTPQGKIADLDLKDEIGRQMADPIARLKEFRRRREQP